MLGFGALASVGRVTPNASRFPQCDLFARLELEWMTRSSRWRAHRHLPLRCADVCRAFADERRFVGGDAGERVRVRNAHPIHSGSAASPTATGTTRDARRSIRFARRA